MASIKVTKKLLKNSKGFLTIKIKDESIEDGDTLFITPDDSMHSLAELLSDKSPKVVKEALGFFDSLVTKHI